MTARDALCSTLQTNSAAAASSGCAKTSMPTGSSLFKEGARD